MSDSVKKAAQANLQNSKFLFSHWSKRWYPDFFHRECYIPSTFCQLQVLTKYHCNKLGNLSSQCERVFFPNTNCKKTGSLGTSLWQAESRIQFIHKKVKLRHYLKKSSLLMGSISQENQESAVCSLLSRLDKEIRSLMDNLGEGLDLIFFTFPELEGVSTSSDLIFGGLVELGSSTFSAFAFFFLGNKVKQIRDIKTATRFTCLYTTYFFSFLMLAGCLDSWLSLSSMDCFGCGTAGKDDKHRVRYLKNRNISHMREITRVETLN